MYHRLVVLRRVIVASAVTLWLSLLAAAPAAAEASAERWLQRAAALHAEAAFEEAVALLERARSKTREPALLARIALRLGVNHVALGNLEAARAAFAEALSHDPLAKLDPQRHTSACIQTFEAVRDKETGVLFVLVDGPPSELVIDGQPAGEPPFRQRVRAGTHAIEVQDALANRRHFRRARVAAGRITTVEIRLTRSEDRSAVPAGQRLGREGLPADRASSKQPDRLWTWVAATTAAACLAIGTGLEIAAYLDHREFQDPKTPDHEAEALEASGRRKATAGHVFLGLGSALVAASVVLYLVEGRAASKPAKNRSADRRRWSLGLDGAVGARFGVTF